eukprot:symbB.v1.2.019063.t2/scaffold1536.1/size113067/3
MLSYQNLEEVTLLLTSHTEMWDVHEVHVKYQRQTSIDPGMPTLRNFTRPTDWERILRKIHYVINHAGLTERVLFNHPVWFRMPGESSKYLRARKVTLGHVEEVVEGNPTLLWLNLHTFDFGQDHAVKGSVASRKDELTHVGGSSSGGEFVLGQASGHLLVKFSMNADPQAMLTRAHNSTRPLVERMADPFRQIIAAPVRWVEAASEVAHCDGDTYCGVGRGYRETDGSPLGPPILSDLPAEGWVKHQGPDGRIFWHHLSLGPPPWDRATARMMERSPINGRVAGTEEDAVLRLPSKEKPIFKEGTQVFNLDLNKGATAEGGGTSSQPLARRSSRSLEAMGPAAVSNMANGTFIRSESRPMEATGPVPVAMAKGTFVRSESRPMEATGPVPVAMAKGTFVRSESRPMEVLMLKPGIDLGHLIVQDKGKKKRVWNQHLWWLMGIFALKMW